jgi:hypothetical protein
LLQFFSTSAKPIIKHGSHIQGHSPRGASPRSASSPRKEKGKDKGKEKGKEKNKDKEKPGKGKAPSKAQERQQQREQAPPALAARDGFKLSKESEALMKAV